ncbi:1805_t:CDS:2 [Racocetra fulgida]|uniref:1805_t:CDS:1 n=1 Tax=Racocetra fulgida TaxID=60492 RepID=A0A9N8WB57_9GLOM|nr:1805_t:CDS:2 [Racocetra fulgida]
MSSVGISNEQLNWSVHMVGQSISDTIDFNTENYFRAHNFMPLIVNTV